MSVSRAPFLRSNSNFNPLIFNFTCYFLIIVIFYKSFSTDFELMKVRAESEESDHHGVPRAR